MPFDRKHPPLGELINLKNRRALITGGAGGIGLAAAQRLAEAGAVVTIIDNNQAKGETAVKTLQEEGLQAFFISCDVSRQEEAVAAVKRACELMGGLDILVNNAGIFPVTPLNEITGGDLEHIAAVNLLGPFYFIREAVRLMIEQKQGGVIINVASVGALHPVRPQMSAYDASKGAIISMTRSLAKELAPDNIRVNAIAPGGIFTEGALAGPAAQNTRAALKETLVRIPLGRMGTADEVARVILFLASDLSTYMTGSLITVDGGFLVS